MASKLCRVSLLGAFEVRGEETPVGRDGLILGSRRHGLGFVIETSRESVEVIVSLVAPRREETPRRLVESLGEFLEDNDLLLERVELVPLDPIPGAEQDSHGPFVQGRLVVRATSGKLRRLMMTAAEAIQVAIAQGLPMLASSALLSLNVGQFLHEIEWVNRRAQAETKQFRSFIHGVTATDFQRFYEARTHRTQGEPTEAGRDIDDESDDDVTPT
jgi:hypothetical protein